MEGSQNALRAKLEPSGGVPRGTLCLDAGTYVVKPRSGALLLVPARGFFISEVFAFEADEVERQRD